MSGLPAYLQVTHSARMIPPATRAGKCNFSTLRLCMPVSRAFLLAALLTLTACGDADSPEQQVRAVIDKMEVAAETRDVSEYEFKVTLRQEDGEWKVSFAQWARK